MEGTNKEHNYYNSLTSHQNKMERLLVSYLSSKTTGQNFQNGLPFEANDTLTKNGNSDQIHNDLTNPKPRFVDDFWKNYSKNDNDQNDSYLSFNNNENGNNGHPDINDKKDKGELDVNNYNNQKQNAKQIQNHNKKSYYPEFSSAKKKNLNLNSNKIQIMEGKKMKKEENTEVTENQKGGFNTSGHKKQYNDNIVFLEIMKQNLLKQASETFLSKNILKAIDKPSTKEKIVEKGKRTLPDLWQYYKKKYPQNAENNFGNFLLNNLLSNKKLFSYDQNTSKYSLINENTKTENRKQNNYPIIQNQAQNFEKINSINKRTPKGKKKAASKQESVKKVNYLIEKRLNKRERGWVYTKKLLLKIGRPCERAQIVEEGKKTFPVLWSCFVDTYSNIKMANRLFGKVLIPSNIKKHGIIHINKQYSLMEYPKNDLTVNNEVALQNDKKNGNGNHKKKNENETIGNILKLQNTNNKRELMSIEHNKKTKRMETETEMETERKWKWGRWWSY